MLQIMMLSCCLFDNAPAVEPILPPDVSALRDPVASWVDEQNPQVTPDFDNHWSPVLEAGQPGERHDALLRILFLASDDVRRLVDAAAADRWAEVDLNLPSIAGSPAVSGNLRLFIAKTLIELGAFDEAGEALADIDEKLCVDPAALVFCMAVCQHSKLDKENGLKSIARLLDPGSVVPERYQSLARLMKQDLEDLDDNELAQTARDMKNLQQKLQRGKSGKKTQQQEKQILERLDKLIEKMEQQQQQAEGQGGQPGNSNNPDAPAQDSNIAGQTGPGEVDRRPIGKSSGWGDLPEKARTDARNLINRQFPSHYRRAVEEYLKKLAERPNK